MTDIENPIVPALESVAAPVLESVAAPVKKQKFVQNQKIYDIFAKALITQNIRLNINNIGSNLKETIEKKIKSDIEGKCTKEGYIKSNSVKIISYSSGKILEGYLVSFEVSLEALICLPVEGMLIECTASSITKAGIKAEIKEYSPSPVIIFISRDHFHQSKYFSQVQEGYKIIVRVIGQRFELNDEFISIIGELVESKREAK